jgi:transposase
MKPFMNTKEYPSDLTDAQWALIQPMIPPPKWATVHDYCRNFRRSGLWQQIHDALREKVRVQEGRKPTPIAAVLDSQSVKTAEQGGDAATTRARKPTVASGI